MGRPQESCRMPEISSSTLLILLGSTLGLVVLILGLVIGISRRLARVEAWLAEWAAHQESSEAAPALQEIPSGGAFESFLKEDPARKSMPKSEQFAEYRRWRQEKGLNWSNS